MLLYILYAFIIINLIYFINIGTLLNIIKIIFYDTSNNTFFLAIILGIAICLISNLKKLKIKYLKKYLNFIIIDILKIIFIKFNYVLIITSFIISLLLIFLNKYFKFNKVLKILLFIMYIVTPLSSIILIKISNNIDKGNISFILLLELFIVIFKQNINFISLSSVKTIIGCLIIIIFTLLNKNNLLNIKKRNIITIFLILIYLIYYYILC